jgi:hypothetical protein
MAKKQEGRRICKCECGGTVRGVEQFDRLWTWCTKCTPVVKVAIPTDGQSV